MSSRRALLLPLAALTLVAALVGCGGDDASASAPSDCTRIEDGRATIVAENLRWDIECFVVEVGTTIAFTVENKDQAVGHNLAIGGPSGFVKTEVEAGPVTQILVYEATTKGRHPFECEPHAGVMQGNLYVE